MMLGTEQVSDHYRKTVTGPWLSLFLSFWTQKSCPVGDAVRQSSRDGGWLDLQWFLNLILQRHWDPSHRLKGRAIYKGKQLLIAGKWGGENIYTEERVWKSYTSLSRPEGKNFQAKWPWVLAGASPLQWLKVLGSLCLIMTQSACC